jgi:hypothetical protein
VQRFVSVLIISVLAAACGASDKPGLRSPPQLAPLKKADGPRPPTKPVASVPAGTVGPFLAAGKDGWLLLWAAPDREQNAWFSRSLDSRGQIRNEPIRLGPAEAVVRLVQVRSADDGDGFLVLHTGEAEAGQTLRAIRLGPGGELNDPPTAVADSTHEIVWIDSVDAGEIWLLLWAERVGDHAELFVATRTESGEISQPKRLSDNARSWQVAGNGEGALLARVGDKGDVHVDALDRAGQIVVTTEIAEGGANGDVDLARTASGFVVGYSSRERLESQVVTALLSLDGKLATRPAVATEPIGEQSLVRLLGGGSGHIVWQNENREPDQLRLSKLSAAGKATGGQLVVPLAPGLPVPQFALRRARPTTLVWACTQRAGCEEPRWPTLITLDDELQPRVVDPWKLASGAPDLAWDLGCTAQGCLGLAAAFPESEGAPTAVFARGRRPEPGTWTTPVWVEESVVPRTESLEAIAVTPTLSDLAVAPRGGGDVLAWLSYFDPTLPYEKPTSPAPDGRMKPVRALLKTQWVPSEEATFAGATALSEPEVISYRARSSGGLALASKEQKSVLVWSAIDGNDPQIFTTLVNANGAKLSQRMQTRSSGDLRSIRASAARLGWLIAWINHGPKGTKGYAARLEDNLNRRTPDIEWPSGGAKVTGLDAKMVAEEAWILTTAGEPNSVKLGRFNERRLDKAAEPVVLGEGSERFSRPELVIDGATRLAVWISTGDSPARVVVRPLTETGEPAGPARMLEIPGAAVQTTSMCSGGICRLIVGTTTGDDSMLYGTMLDRENAPVRKLLPLLDARALDVPVAESRSVLWLFDGFAGSRQQGVHRAQIRWQR